MWVMRIAISGPNAVGVTSVTELVAKRMGLKPVTYTFVDLARELGSTREQLDARKAAEFPKLDYELDKRNIAHAVDGTVFGSDISIWLIEADLKVWLHAPWRVRAERLAKRDNIPVAAAASRIRERDAFYVSHFKKLYGLNWKKGEDQAHILVNTAGMDAQKVSEVIAAAAQTIPFPGDKRARAKTRKIQRLISQGSKGTA